MKKLISLTLAMLMIFGSVGLTAFAEDAPVTADVYVTIANKGSLAVVQEKITVTDRDNDGKLNIDEVLFAAHEAEFKGGAAAGYETAVDEWGLCIKKLWGDTSGNFGYYVNNASAWGLIDEVADGDYVNAYIYTDGEFYSDTYCRFDLKTVSAESGEEISLVLKGAGYDESWQPIEIPVENAVITLNGEKTEYKTDKDGKVTFTVSAAGSYIISAVSDSQILVPPVCILTVTADIAEEKSPSEENTAVTETKDNTDNSDKASTSPATGESRAAYLLAVIMLVSLSVAVIGKRAYEK